jgi:WD40 repeat protein
MAFDAFMSYSHAADGQLAPALQRGLHQLGKPWYRKRALRVFRDKTTLSANPALWPSIERALAESSYFLLLASPAAAKSHWVTSEVTWWLSNRPIDKLLIVLTDGELVWDSTKQDFDWDRTDAVSRGLEGRLSSEPLYVDLRWARTVNDLSLRHTQFRGAVLDLAAPLHGIPKDDLDGEDVRQYRRMRQVRFVAIFALVAVATLAVWQAVEARMQANRAVAQRLAAQADLSRRGEAYSCLDRTALLAVTSLSMTPLLETNRLVQELLQVLPVATIPSPKDAQSLVISPSGRHLVTQNKDGLTRIHDLERGEELRALEHKARPGMVHFDQTGNTVISVIDADRSPSRVRTIDLSSLEAVEHPPLAGYVRAVAVRPDRTALAATVSSAVVSVLDAHTGTVIATVPEEHRDTKARFSRSGKHVAISFGDILARVGVLHIIDTMTGEDRTLRFDLPVMSLTFSADDKYLALTEQFVWGSRAANAYLVDLDTGKILRTMPVPPNAYLLEFSPDGERLALGGTVGIEIVNVPDGTRLSRPAVSDVSAATFTPDSQSIVVGSSSTSLPQIAKSVGDETELGLREASCDLGRLRIFDAESGIERVKLDRKANSGQVVFGPDGHRLVVGGFRGQGATTIQIFDYSEAGSHVPVRAFQNLAARSSVKRFTAETTADGRYLVTVGDRRVLAVFEIATGTQVGATDLPIGPVAMSPDGHHFAVTTAADVERGGEHDQRVAVRVFEVATMKASSDIPLDGPPLMIQIDNGARRLFFVDKDAKLHVIDLATRAPLAAGVLDMSDVVAFAFSPDGRLIAISGDKSDAVELRDVVANKLSASLKHAQEVSTIVFSPDGSHLATAEGLESSGVGGRGKVNVYDLSTGKVVFEVPYEGGAPAPSFSKDGTMLLVKLATGVMRVFGLADRVEKTRFAAPGRVASVAVGDGNRQILIVSDPVDDGLPQVYSRQLRPADLIASVCSRLTRNLTWDEWAQYFGDDPYEKSCRNLPCPSGGQAKGSSRCVRD